MNYQGVNVFVYLYMYDMKKKYKNVNNMFIIKYFLVELLE